MSANVATGTYATATYLPLSPAFQEDFAACKSRQVQAAAGASRGRFEIQ